ncbi:MAG: DUF350 domain-containing protein, partial [bacterium]|nr:DUF350 domain-containing protein [bacterium]
MIWNELMESGIYLVCAYVLFWIGKLVYDITTPSYSMREELTEKDNTALAVAVTGYYFGLVLAIGSVLSGPSHGLETDLIDVLIYGPLAIVLMNLSRIVNDRLILYRFSTRDEIVRDQNVGTGVVVCASYIATGLVIYGAVAGVLGNVMTAVAFWALGQVALILAGLVYGWITPYNVHEEIERDNVAAGVGFAGALVGIGILVMHASAGDFISWAINLQEFAFEVVIGLVLLPIAR